MSMDYEEQYDKIYRYCFFKLHDRECAEDVTQEAFLRFLDSSGYEDTGRALPYLYTIARNLCTDEYRKHKPEPLTEDIPAPDAEPRILTALSIKQAMSCLEAVEQELLLLRFVNEVPVSAIAKMLGMSRFAVYRKTTGALKRLQHKLRKEDFL